MPDERKPVTHELKTWPIHFKAVESGAKPFELRRNDRDFRVGDILRLKEYDNKTHQYTGREEEREITYMLGLADFFGDIVLADECGYVILGLAATSHPSNKPMALSALFELEEDDAVWVVSENGRILAMGAECAQEWASEDRALFFAAKPTAADIEAARKEADCK